MDLTSWVFDWTRLIQFTESWLQFYIWERYASMQGMRTTGAASKVWMSLKLVRTWKNFQFVYWNCVLCIKIFWFNPKLSCKNLFSAAYLLGISSSDLGLCLTTRSVTTCGETFMRRQNGMEARTTRDSLARGLYNRLFRWIVNQINALLGISRLA